MILDEFGPASEHVRTKATVTLAATMMQRDEAQIVADTFRATER